MTYLVGLRTDRGICLAADSVLNSSTPSTKEAASEENTVFGELQGDVGSRPLRYVSEEGLKLALGEDMVVGFTGHVGIAQALIQAYFDGRASGMGAREAVRGALVSVTPCSEEAQILFGFYEANTPCLLLVNTIDASNREVEGLIQLGNELSSGQHDWTRRLVDGYLERLDRLGSDPWYIESVFSRLVAILQSYGVHEHLLKHGVGGAFVAVWVTPVGARWQGDHLYVIHGETPAFEDPTCATMVRDSVLCLITNQTQANKVILWPRRGESPTGTTLRAKSAWDRCVDARDNGTFDYLVLLNRSKHIVTIVEMCGQQHHELISLHAPRIEEHLGMVWTEKLRQYANTIAGVQNPDPEYMSVYFFPFREISGELQQEREQFAWENFVEWHGKDQ